MYPWTFYPRFVSGQKAWVQDYRVDTGSYATMYGGVVEVNLQLQILLLVTFLALGQHSSYSLPVLAADNNNYVKHQAFLPSSCYK